MDQKGSNSNNQLLIAIGLFVVIVVIGIAVKLSMPAKTARSVNYGGVETTAHLSADRTQSETHQETEHRAQQTDETSAGVQERNMDGAGGQEAGNREITGRQEMDGDSESLILADEYILPYSDSRYYTEEDLQQLTREQIRIARNEIYARRGRKFKDEQLQEYFNNCSWYVGSIEPDRFNEQLLNTYEIANRDLITVYEEKNGYR